MYTSVYIAGDELRAVMGERNGQRISVREYASVPLPSGAIVNGVITDEEPLKNALRAMREQYPRIRLKKARLTIGSSLVYAKRMRAPKIPDKKLLMAARGEFSGMEDAEKLVYGVTHLKPEGGADMVLVSAVKRELLESYIGLFKSAGVEVESINTILGAENRLVSAMPELRERDFILIVMDGSNMDAVLYTGGSYRFSNRLRLIAERGDVSIGAEVQRTVSSLLQFNFSEKSGARISDVYIAGLEDGERGVMADIKANLNLDAHELSDGSGVVSAGEGFDIARYLYPLGDIASAKGDLDLMARMSDNAERDRKTRRRVAAIVPLAALVLILGAVFGVQMFSLVKTAAQAAAVQAYISAPETQNAYNKALSDTERRNVCAALKGELDDNMDAAASYPALDAYLFKSIDSCTGESYSVSSYAYAEETGLLTLGADAASELYMPELVQRLRNTGLFLDIGYTGYVNDTDGLYHATMECLLAPQSAEEEAGS